MEVNDKKVKFKCPICKKASSAISWNVRTKQIAQSEGRYGYNEKDGFPKVFPKVGDNDQVEGKFSCPECYRSEISGSEIVGV